MTARERILSLIIAGLLLAVVVSWGFGKYRTAIRLRETQLANLNNEAATLNERRLAGARADRMMGEYLVRSLPSDPDAAQSVYQSWLLETVRRHGLIDPVVNPSPAVPVGDLYRRLGFIVSGRTDLPHFVDLLHAIAACDTLHRVREVNVAPARTGDLSVSLTMDAIALAAAAPDATLPKGKSWRVTQDLAAYRDTILNRNFFSPPNQPPRYEGQAELVATRGKTTDFSLRFSDPEASSLSFIAPTDLPPFVRFDVSSGRISVTASEEIQEPVRFTVGVTDLGFPQRRVDQELTISFRDPPPPEKPAPPPLQFDDASQTFLTALVHGRDDWTAWMNVRTRGQTLKLRVGDAFEIGSVKGTVTSVTSRAVELEIDGTKYELRPMGKLLDAIKPAE